MAVIRGFGFNDDLVGTPGADEVYGLEGADTLDGGGGDDRLFGGPGDDLILAGPTGLGPTRTLTARPQRLARG